MTLPAKARGVKLEKHIDNLLGVIVINYPTHPSYSLLIVPLHTLIDNAQHSSLLPRRPIYVAFDKDELFFHPASEIDIIIEVVGAVMVMQ